MRRIITGIPVKFFEKRRTSKRPYVYDLRSYEAYEL